MQSCQLMEEQSRPVRRLIILCTRRRTDEPVSKQLAQGDVGELPRVCQVGIAPLEFVKVQCQRDDACIFPRRDAVVLRNWVAFVEIENLASQLEVSFALRQTMNG